VPYNFLIAGSIIISFFLYYNKNIDNTVFRQLFNYINKKNVKYYEDKVNTQERSSYFSPILMKLGFDAFLQKKKKLLKKSFAYKPKY